MQTNTRTFVLLASIALVFGFAGAAAWSFSGLADNRTRDYLLAHPELLPQMADAYQKQLNESKLAGIADQVTTPFPGASFGNPKGTVTLVEFSDYACGYCRASQEHVAALVKANPDLRVVVREWPIFEGSDKTALIALAAAKQGKFAAFHHAMYAKGPPSEATIMASVAEAGIDLALAREFAATPEGQNELSRNAAWAQQIGFTGTPSWVIGDRVLEGAVGPGALQEAIDAARKR